MRLSRMMVLELMRPDRIDVLVWPMYE